MDSDRDLVAVMAYADGPDPRDRYGNFHPRILAILRHQEDECERLAGTLYTKGLTQEQVGEIFQDIYGEHYSKTSISRMLDYLREDVSQWLTRSLEAYYPIVFIDCVHMKIHRKRSVETEAFYVELAVREDKWREMLGIFNKPTECALSWPRICGRFSVLGTVTIRQREFGNNGRLSERNGA